VLVLGVVLTGYLLSLEAPASATLQFSDVTGSLNGLSDRDGATPQDGLTWGILVDTTGSGFGGFKIRVELDEGVELSDGGELASGYVFYYGNTTTFWPIGVNTGSGAVTETPSLPLDGGERFAVIWFDAGIGVGENLPAGAYYGLVTHPDFEIPPGGGNVAFASLFPETDPPVRAADGRCKAGSPRGAVAKVVAAGGQRYLAMDLRVFNDSVTGSDPEAGIGAEIVMQASETMAAGSWQDLGVVPEVLSDDGTWSVWRFVPPCAIGVCPREYFRLRSQLKE